jgi:glycosylphosphatidylinositol transamidase
MAVLLNVFGPAAILFASSVYWNVPISEMLIEAAFGWDIWGMWTQVVVWCVWWPAWITGSVLLAASVGMTGEKSAIVRDSETKKDI